jgi:hypothetical protein
MIIFITLLVAVNSKICPEQTNLLNETLSEKNIQNFTKDIQNGFFDTIIQFRRPGNYRRTLIEIKHEGWARIQNVFQISILVFFHPKCDSVVNRVFTPIFGNNSSA